MIDFKYIENLINTIDYNTNNNLDFVKFIEKGNKKIPLEIEGQNKQSNVWRRVSERGKEYQKLLHLVPNIKIKAKRNQDGTIEEWYQQDDAKEKIEAWKEKHEGKKPAEQKETGKRIGKSEKVDGKDKTKDEKSPKPDITKSKEELEKLQLKSLMKLRSKDKKTTDDDELDEKLKKAKEF